jgi:hypothetical protein
LFPRFSNVHIGLSLTLITTLPSINGSARPFCRHLHLHGWTSSFQVLLQVCALLSILLWYSFFFLCRFRVLRLLHAVVRSPLLTANYKGHQQSYRKSQMHIMFIKHFDRWHE